MMKNKLKDFIKKETVLCIVAVLAAVSCFFVPPSADYIGYMDFRTLSLLFSLMTVMAGFSECGVFTYFARRLLERTHTLRGVCAVLVMLCFFTSMAVTNDVALITFVPFAIEVLTEADRRGSIMKTVIFQTVAANLGSMLTPIGNPQNLYLYSLSGMGAAELIKTMLPYTAMSFVLVCVCLFMVKKNDAVSACTEIGGAVDKKGAAVYAVLFGVCMLTVGGLLHYAAVLAVVAAAVLLYDRRILARVDYSLIMTFMGFFIFIGNIKNIGALSEFLKTVIVGNEFAAAVIGSQIISNVPAAVLLSGFSQRYELIMIGADIGGLGTLIASMASLISYKYFVNFAPDKKGRYVALFTAVNIVFLAVMIVLFCIIDFKGNI